MNLEGQNTGPTQEESVTFLDVLQEGYYWGLLRRVEGEEWENHLKELREETADRANNVLVK